MENGKIATIPITRNKLFYRWLELTKPFHKLSEQPIVVLSWLLYYYDKYKTTTKDEDLAWKLTFDYDTKMLIKEDMGIKDQTLQNVFTKLRKSNIIKDNKIMSNYIPNLTEDAKEFKLIFNFKIIDE